MKLVQIIEKGMAKANAQKTVDALGDRTSYVGASDLGQCPRKVIHEKIMDQGEEALDLTTLIRFARGHITEDIIGEALHIEKYKARRQVELCGQTKAGTPLIFHLDFVFENSGRCAILETKSTTPIPDTPWESWEMQLHAQMGLAHDLMGSSTQIDGAIFALNVAPKDGDAPYGAWNSYKPNQDLWLELQATADLIYQAVQQYKMSGNLPDDIPLSPGPLCGYCPVLHSCPAFKGEQLPPEISKLVQHYLSLQDQRKKIAKQEDAVKDQIKTLLRDEKGWGRTTFEGGKTVAVKVRQKNSRRTDFKAVRQALESYNDSLDNYSFASSYEELVVKAEKS